MTPADVADRCLAADVRLSGRGGRLVYNAPVGALTDDLLADLRAHKNALLALLTAKREVDGDLIPAAAGGWVCPGCRAPRVVFFGVGDRHVCRSCLEAG